MTSKVSLAINKGLSEAAKTNSGRVHIIYRGGSKWAVKKEGSLVAKRVLNSKTEAINLGKELVKENKATMVIVHDENGMVAS